MGARGWNIRSIISRTIVQIVDRNRRASIHRSHLSLVTLEKLFPGRKDILAYRHPAAGTPPLGGGQFELLSHSLDGALDSPYPGFSRSFLSSHFKQRGIVWSFLGSRFCLWSVSSSI